MSGSTTIDQTGYLASINIGGTVVIEQNASSPMGNPVLVGFNTSVANIDVGSTFIVQDHATFDLGADVNIAAGNLFLIGENGTLELGPNVSVGLLNDISFVSGASGGMLIAQSGLDLNLLGNISGFHGGESIDFAGIGAPLSATSYSDSFTGTDTDFTITLSGGGTENFALAGNLTGSPFSLMADGNGGVIFADNACFAPGTRILTTAGETPVEDLRIGDIAVLADGATAPVTFIGHRQFDLKRHPRPEAVRPIKITAGALADGIPARDLTLSPDHALLLDGVLVQAKDLVDGIAITQDKTRLAIRYYHVELPSHGILLAEGAAAESYLDTGHRGLFDNVKDLKILHPDLMQMRREAESVAPLCRPGPKLAAIRRALQARTLAAGVSQLTSLDIWARTGSIILTPRINTMHEARFNLPPETTKITVQFPVFVPAEFDPSSIDRRHLGVALQSIHFDGTEFPLTRLNADQLHPQSPADPHVWTKSLLELTLPHPARTMTLTFAARPKTWHINRAA
jgi:hypothetical protein